jgi:hypothetical protein
MIHVERPLLVRARVLAIGAVAIAASGAASAGDPPPVAPSAPACGGDTVPAGYRKVVLTVGPGWEDFGPITPLDEAGQACLAAVLQQLVTTGRFKGSLPVGDYANAMQRLSIPAGDDPLAFTLIGVYQPSPAPTCGPCCHGSPDCYDGHELQPPTAPVPPPEPAKKKHGKKHG